MIPMPQPARNEQAGVEHPGVCGIRRDVEVPVVLVTGGVVGLVEEARSLECRSSPQQAPVVVAAVLRWVRLGDVGRPAQRARLVARQRTSATVRVTGPEGPQGRSSSCPPHVPAQRHDRKLVESRPPATRLTPPSATGGPRPAPARGFPVPSSWWWTLPAPRRCRAAQNPAIETADDPR